MDISTVMHSDTISPIGVRNPLIPRTISPQSTPVKNVRRKGSFFRQADSSEDSPLSSSSSIFEAFMFSGSNSEESAYKLDSLPRIKRPVFDGTRLNNENIRQPSSSRSEPIATPTIPDNEFLYGHGTPLDTITEQKSYGTIRSIARTKSADDMFSAPLLGHRDSIILAKNSPRRKHSFSLDDIWSIKDSYHEACAMIERVARRSLTINEIYAKPKEPLLAPPERPGTPEGCPSWTTAQLPGPRPHIVPQHTRLQRILRMPSSGLTLSTRSPSTGFSFTGRSVSAPIGTPRLPPRFRVPKSVYSAIESHPFSNAPIHKTDSEPPTEPPRPIPAPVSVDQPLISRIPISASTSIATSKAKGKGKARIVRFTPSATARDSEMVNLQNAMEATRSTALHPLSVLPPCNPPILTTGCPHRKNRRAPLKTLNAKSKALSSNGYGIPPSNEYLPLPSLSSVTSLPKSAYSLARSAVSLQMSTLERVPVITIKPPSISFSSHSAAHDTATDENADIGIIDVDNEDVNNNENENDNDNDTTTDITRTASLSSSNAYFMSGALYLPNTPESAIEVPIVTGAHLMTIPQPSRASYHNNENENGDVDGVVSLDDGGICWKCRLQGVKMKIDGWCGRSGDWICFVCCGGGDLIGDGWDVEEEARRRRAVLAGVPGVGL